MVGHLAEGLFIQAQHLQVADGSHGRVAWTRGEQSDLAEVLAGRDSGNVHVAVLDPLDDLRLARRHDIELVSRLTLGHNDVTTPVPRPPQPGRRLGQQRSRRVREGFDQPFVASTGPVEPAGQTADPPLTLV